MNNERPNPDILLERVKASDKTLGRLKIYLGMAAGAGKTYSMLSDALMEKKRGTDVVAGYIEPHGRNETEELALSLEQIPFRMFENKGVSCREFDLDAALKRKPQILLIDELAHSNAPDSRHLKRWQDIEECLSQGINVYTTVNVQHIESLTDVVTKITGITVHETVPDSVVKRADEIELIDITPEELTQRLKDGKVYVAEKAKTALANFFRPGNLLALRELVLRLTAERVDDQLTTYRRLYDIREVWPAKPRVLVCISPNYLSERVIRTAARLAHSMHTDLVAVSVESFSQPGRREEYEKLVQNGLELAEELGAEIIRASGNDVVAEILRAAHDKNANMIVVGKPVRSRIREYLLGSIVDELIRQSGELDIYVITDKVRTSRVPLMPSVGPPTLRGMGYALGVTGFTTLFCALVYPYLELSNLVMFYLLAVAWAGTKLGRLESVVTSILSVLIFDFCFVPPRWTFAVEDAQYFVTFIVMLVIALLISTLTLQLKAQAELVGRRERRTAALYDVSKKLAGAVSMFQIALIAREKAKELFGGEALLLIPNSTGELESPLSVEGEAGIDSNELAVARWVSEHKSSAGAGTDTLSGAKFRYFPLVTKKPAASVLGVSFNENWLSSNEPVLEAFSAQIGSAIERVYAEVEATETQVEFESERVRNILLSSISHDFRSPLAAISGAAETLEQKFDAKDLSGMDLLLSIKDESSRLSRLVRNVLALTRLESGEVRLKLEWQSIEELVGTALERTGALLGNRQVNVSLPAELPLIEMDATLMEQVLINLLENVAKHTQSNCEINITARVEMNSLIFEVSDSGPGLPPGKESQVFEKSYRGANNEQGFGLGLTICDVIVRSHGGEITAMNNPTGGATFILKLPLPSKQPELLYGK